MTNEELKVFIKDYIKENVKVLVECKKYSSECSYNEYVYVNLYLEDELISSSEIEGLVKDY